MAMMLKMVTTQGEGTLPEFRLKDHEVIIETRTYVRAPGALMDKNDLFKDLSSLSRGARASNVVLPLDAPVEFGNVFALPGDYVAPSFTTVAVGRVYGLDLKATVGCLGDEFKFRVKLPRVTVFSTKVKLDELGHAR